jgi:8-oxo-dGTP diphosphatase
VVIVDGNRQVLLLKHVIRPGTGWGLPGGFIDRGEQPEDAIRREIEEETGLGLIDLEPLRIRIVGTHIEFLFTAKPKGEATVGSREILELGWFDAGELPAGLSLAQAEIIRQVLGGEH